METEGQISPDERGLLTRPILAAPKVNTVLEIGTWLGVGSTIEILRALQQNNNGHLWGIRPMPRFTSA
jgi:predicted O-methyltransferase YrrM